MRNATGLNRMARYFFHIASIHPFQDDDGMEHPSDECAWREALRLTHDVEQHLQPGGHWILTVYEGDRLVYRIEVSATTARPPSSKVPE